MFLLNNLLFNPCTMIYVQAGYTRLGVDSENKFTAMVLGGACLHFHLNSDITI